LLGGANAFAIDADGEWEIVQALDCVLVAPNEYELSGFLRGRLGTAHAMRAPHGMGARIVKLDAALVRVGIGAHEWNEVLTLSAPPPGALATDPRATSANVLLPHAALRPWAPAHLRAVRGLGGDVAVTWVRCARTGGDNWGAGEPPLGAPTECYMLEIMSGAEVRRTVSTTAAAYVYTTMDQTADFGGLPGSLHLRVAQLDGAGVPGLKKELTIAL
jgi:hypothetical protein